VEDGPPQKLNLKSFNLWRLQKIKKIYTLFLDETYKVTFKYPEIKRGVRYWIKKWHNGKDS